MRAQIRIALAAGVALGPLLAPGPLPADDEAHARLAAAAERVMPAVVAWRHDIHAHPELSNREVRTAALVADHLRALGFDEVRTEVAHTGVVGILRGGLPGPTVALRADMDALPVVEQTGLPYASSERTTFNGQEVGVMHACGHDAHTAILMGVAEVLAGLRADLPGTVLVLFQPAEEGPPEGEEGGATLVLAEGALDDPAPAAIFGLHVGPLPTGLLTYREGALLAAADGMTIEVEGRQTHGSSPWLGIDPIIVSAEIMTALQMIPSRQLDVTKAPAVVSVGSIHGGVRGNIIPDRVEMTGTVRTLDDGMRSDLLRRIETTATRIAESAGASARVTFNGYAPVTFNDPELARATRPSLEWAAGADHVAVVPPIMGAEDFSFYQRKIPGFYFFLGVNEPGVGAYESPPNHSPRFTVNDDALLVGVRALAGVAWDYLSRQPAAPLTP